IEMIKVTSAICQQAYKVDIKAEGGTTLVSDEPVSNGGQNLGPSPQELLAAALAACTSITVKMYAARKGWDLQDVYIDVDLDRLDGENMTVINRAIRFTGNLDEAQTARLTAIANACPVHKILTNPITVNTTLQ
ncbi:MAG TPA: OsmC family protein, partial [Chitinophagales bacterium]|nr:OsmC family protein [Chitinophagales bacterium]